MSRLKVQIESLSEEWEIEVKEHGTNLNVLIIRSKFNSVRTNPKVWSTQTCENTFLPGIHKRIRQASKNPHLPKKITINDGTRFIISYAVDEDLYELTVCDFVKGTNEYGLVEQLLDSIVKWINAPELVSLYNSWKSKVSNQ